MPARLPERNQIAPLRWMLVPGPPCRLLLPQAENGPKGAALVPGPTIRPRSILVEPERERFRFLGKISAVHADAWLLEAASNPLERDFRVHEIIE